MKFFGESNLKIVTKRAQSKINAEYEKLHAALLRREIEASKIKEQIRILEANYSEIGIKIQKPITDKNILTNKEKEDVYKLAWLKGISLRGQNVKDYSYLAAFLDKLNYTPSLEVLGYIFCELVKTGENSLAHHFCVCEAEEKFLPISKETTFRLIKGGNRFTWNKKSVSPRRITALIQDTPRIYLHVDGYRKNLVPLGNLPYKKK